jgi:hypothetical protein
MVVEQSSLESVKARLAGLKRKRPGVVSKPQIRE